MKLSYVIITRNRRDRLLRTLRLLPERTPIGEAGEDWEAIVVDNASDDDTVTTVGRHFDGVRVIALAENEGMPARNWGIRAARGKFIAFLDDDSFPIGSAIPDALTHLSRHPRTAAVVARVMLPDGQVEAPAFPTVTLGGASICRKSALTEVGGFAAEFFRQAEEYDLSFRLWRAGYRIERFEDVLFAHEKEPGGRSSALTHRMDLRNNLILVERYLPPDTRRAYRRDWMRRYAALAKADGCGGAVATALLEARIWARRERQMGRQTLPASTIESLFHLDAQARAVSAWAKRHALRRLVIADCGKNLYATWQACRRANLQVSAVADHRPAFIGGRYRNAPIQSVADALKAGPDGVVIANINAGQIDDVQSRIAAAFDGPVLRLWEPTYLRDRMRPPAPMAQEPAAAMRSAG